jgi:hypothetical protein
MTPESPRRVQSLPLARSIRVCGFLCLATLASVSLEGRGGLEPRRPPRAWPETTQMVLFGVGLNCVGLGLGRRQA